MEEKINLNNLPFVKEIFENISSVFQINFDTIQLMFDKEVDSFKNMFSGPKQDLDRTNIYSGAYPPSSGGLSS